MAALQSSYPRHHQRITVNPVQMRAAWYNGAGDTDVIEIRDVPAPAPGPHEVRVRVHAAGLNRADILQRKGHYPAPPGWPSQIPGLEYAGTVEVRGPGASRWQTGDRVMGLVGGGAHAETVVVREDEAMPIPRALSYTEAAAIPEAFLTAWDALVHRARIATGDRVLIHAAGSGVGTAAVQLSRFLGAHTVGTSRTAAKLERLMALGLDEAIDTSRGSLAEQLSEPVHAVIDLLGGPALQQNLAALLPRGRLVLLGLLLGSQGEVDLGFVLRQRLEIIGTVMRSRGPAERATLVREFIQEVLPAFAISVAGENARLRPVVDTVLPMKELGRAHRLMEENDTFGKVVLSWA
ncbi:MAG: Quinone oxidoreductase [Gemmatimonadetes bacterium]|nr:Quinone oxidoreductase [Gemmatimonadota bacterium]